MRRQRSFKRSTTAEDGDMALALAWDQVESQRATGSAVERPLHRNPGSALTTSSLTGELYHNPGTCRFLSSIAI